MELKAYLESRRRLVEDFLVRLLPEEGPLAGHYAALRYSLLAGGKRVRPLLAMAAAEALGREVADAMPVVCALECIHTYSLIHDDLPAMDNDDLRRGKPTNHKVFGEAEAILAGDGLLTLAFELLASPDAAPGLCAADRLRIVHLVAVAAGSAGMVGGQSLDLDAEGRNINLEELRRIHRCKTGALITASVQTGAILGGADRDQFSRLTEYGDAIGLAFQMKDDLLNVEGDVAEMGKAVGSDARHNKATYPGLLGMEESRRQLSATVDLAIGSLAGFDGKADHLRELALYILNRRR